MSLDFAKLGYTATQSKPEARFCGPRRYAIYSTIVTDARNTAMRSAFVWSQGS